MKLTKEWITGFVDGDGCFSIVKKQPNSQLVYYGFYVSQDQKSVDVLYALKKEFGCGSVHRAGGTMYNYAITNDEHVRDKIIPHFIQYPLQTEKRTVFYHWANSFWEYMKERGKTPGAPLPSLEKGYRLTAGWFRGFVDAEGCFYVSIVGKQVMPRFVLGARAGEKELIQQCYALIQCGTMHTRKKGGFETLQVSSIEQLENKLIPFFETRGSAVLLRTRKRLAFQKFRKIVRFMIEKRHLSPDGMEKIRKYAAALSQANRPIKLANISVVEDIVQTDWKQSELSPLVTTLLSPKGDH